MSRTLRIAERARNDVDSIFDWLCIAQYQARSPGIWLSVRPSTRLPRHRKRMPKLPKRSPSVGHFVNRSSRHAAAESTALCSNCPMRKSSFFAFAVPDNLPCDSANCRAIEPRLCSQASVQGRMSFREFITNRLFRSRLQEEFEDFENIRPPANPSRRCCFASSGAGARQGERRLFGAELDVTQPVFQAAHQRRLGAPAKVAVDAFANGLDVRHFQLGDLGDNLPDRRVIVTVTMVEKMLDSAHKVLDLGFVDAGSAARRLRVAFVPER